MGFYEYIRGTLGIMPIINAATPLTSYIPFCHRDNIMHTVEKDGAVIAADDNGDEIENINPFRNPIAETVNQLDPPRHPLPFDKLSIPATIKIDCHIPGLTIYNPATRVHLPDTISVPKTNTNFGSPRAGCLRALREYRIVRKPLEAKNKRYWREKLCKSRPEGMRVWRGGFLERLEGKLKKIVTARLRNRGRSVEEKWERVEKEMVKAGLMEGQMDPELVVILRKKSTRRRGKTFDSDGGQALRRRVLGMECERRRARETVRSLDVDGSGH
jgi:hypothetical protein